MAIVHITLTRLNSESRLLSNQACPALLRFYFFSECLLFFFFFGCVIEKQKAKLRLRCRQNRTVGFICILRVLEYLSDFYALSLNRNTFLCPEAKGLDSLKKTLQKFVYAGDAVSITSYCICHFTCLIHFTFDTFTCLIHFLMTERLSRS